MKIALLGIHIVVSILLTTVILLQSGKGGLGTAFGGQGGYRSKRGAEKLVFYATFVLSVLFLLTSVANMIFE